MLMSNILEQVTFEIRKARLEGNKNRLDDLVVLKADIAHGLSQKQPVKAQKTIERLITSYKATQSLMRDSKAVERYQEKIALLESFLLQEEQLDTNQMQQLLLDNDFLSIREWMSFLKTNYPDQYDGRLASTLYNNNYGN
jgi:hypothetical protein